MGRKPPRLCTIDLPDADLSYLLQLALPLSPAECFARLRDETPWREEPITLFGKTYMQPRLLAWYGDAGAVYRYSGRTFTPAPWTNLLRSVRACVEDATGCSFNSALLNLYRDHRDGMGFHSDNEKELGPDPVIASLSLGATRDFQLKHKTDKAQRFEIGLEGGSLLLMKGATQANWKHGVPKRATPCGPRINLTFRRVMGRVVRPAAD